MSIDDLTGLITVILAISLASERLVTFLKTLIPWLADKAPGQLQPLESDYWRQLIVMLLAFILLANICTISRRLHRFPLPH